MLFWKNWHSPYRQFIYACLIFLSGVIGFIVYYYTIGFENAIPLRIENELESIIVPYDTFFKNHLQWMVEGTAFVSNSRYVVGGITENNLCAELFLVFIIAACALFLTYITSLPRYYFLGGILLFMLIFVQFEFHVLLENKWYLPSVLLAFGLTAYLFHAFFPSTPHIFRFISFLSLIFISGFFVFYSNDFLVTLQYTVNHGLQGLLIVCFLFILFISAEGVNLITYFCTLSDKPEKRAGKYLFFYIGSAYCLFLLIYYMRTAEFFGSFYLFPPAIFLLLINAVAGFFSFYFKINSINKLSPYRIPFVMIYASVSLLALSTIGFLYGTENDTLYKGIEEQIIYSQFSFSWAYFIFVAANFYSLFEKKMQVWKVIFKPHQNSPLLYLIMGVTVLFVVISRSGYSGYYQYKSGISTALADLYWQMNNKPMAGGMYKDALSVNVINNKALYGNALIKIIQDDPIAARVSLESGISKNNSPYIYLQLSELFLNNNNFFEGLFTLRDGLKKYPGNTALQNNLALLYEKTGLSDSACFFLQKSNGLFQNNKLATSNLLSIYTRHKNETEGLKLIIENKKSSSPSFETNKLAFYALYGIFKPLPFEKKYFNEINLDNNRFCYLYNYGVYHLKNQNDSVTWYFNKYSQKAIFKFQRENLDFLTGVLHYYRGQVEEGKNNLLAVSHESGTYEGMSNDILGKWMFEQGAYELSADYFKRNMLINDTASIFNYCESIAESGKFEEAKNIFMSLRHSSYKESAQEKISIFDSLSLNRIKEMDDFNKARIIHLHLNTLFRDTLMLIYNSIRENKPLLSSSAELLHYFYHQKNITKMRLINEKVSWMKNDSSDLYQNYQLAKYWLDFEEKKYTAILDGLKKIKPFHALQFEYDYLLAKVYIALNKHKEGMELLEKIASLNPFFEKALIELAKIHAQNDNELKSYLILLSGIKNNPYSVTIMKEYSLAALNVGRTDDAVSVFETLRFKLDEQEFRTFDEEFQKRVKDREILLPVF
ncbi:MAG: hypothetical protein A3H98_00840 [Bacteroidetes bacterium RIFCSPLOWO2_02_FULL_36_8]|nr:MAG: hypothetical protein A3H98_00840 [Bacteroidetes bacterium RIFCSPLOWO2_02_FULL_36_8]OFY72064.1 MAG: hypothetical protein A3G23_06775 [Bacteroidetes bacterium RIFCSPLOWO2_12_FULL_37_12]